MHTKTGFWVAARNKTSVFIYLFIYYAQVQHYEENTIHTQNILKY